MTKKQRKEHKQGNQERKKKLMKINKSAILKGGVHITVPQDGRYTSF